MQVGQHVHSIAWEANAVPANFLVVDDHPLFLEALRLSLNSAFPNSNVTEASSITEARKASLRW